MTSIYQQKKQDHHNMLLLHKYVMQTKNCLYKGHQTIFFFLFTFIKLIKNIYHIS